MNITFTRESPNISFSVDMPPAGKARPRFSTKTHHTYTPQKTVDDEKRIRAAYKKASGGFRYPDNTPLDIVIMAYFPIPTSTTKKKFALMLERVIFPTKKPDWDNIGKLVADALNGVAYDDDKNIVMGMVVKRYSQNPGIRVILSEHKEVAVPEKITEFFEMEEEQK